MEIGFENAVHQLKKKISWEIQQYIWNTNHF